MRPSSFGQSKTQPDTSAHFALLNSKFPPCFFDLYVDTLGKLVAEHRKSNKHSCPPQGRRKAQTLAPNHLRRRVLNIAVKTAILTSAVLSQFVEYHVP